MTFGIFLKTSEMLFAVSGGPESSLMGFLQSSCNFFPVGYGWFTWTETPQISMVSGRATGRKKHQDGHSIRAGNPDSVGLGFFVDLGSRQQVSGCCGRPQLWHLHAGWRLAWTDNWASIAKLGAHRVHAWRHGFSLARQVIFFSRPNTNAGLMGLCRILSAPKETMVF